LSAQRQHSRSSSVQISAARSIRSSKARAEPIQPIAVFHLAISSTGS
jgi:hypothetical protein